MTTVKYSKKGNSCPKKCGGQIMFDGRGTKKLPIGFGFVGGAFVIDTMVQTGWVGECMKCNAKVFAVEKIKHARKRPRSINNKIVAARKAVA